MNETNDGRPPVLTSYISLLGILIWGLFALSSCVVPAEVGPDRTAYALATTNCVACTMTLMTKFDTITFDFPDAKNKLQFKYQSDSTMLVKISVKPLTDQSFNVRLFDKDNIQVYYAPEKMAKAGSMNDFAYSFKPKQ